MRDKGLDKGLIKDFDASERGKRGFGKGFFGFRKMFWDYLNKLGVAFHDTCCEDASTALTYPVRYNANTGVIQYYDGTWKTVPAGPLNPTTTTTTTSSSTTTTTSHA